MSDYSQYDKPHIPEKCRAGLIAAHKDKPLAKFTPDPEQLLSQLRDGKSVAQLSSELGVSDVAFYTWALRNCPDEYLAISAGRSLARIERAETLIDDAETQLDVSKGRESARLAQWTAERAARKFFGDVKQDNSGVNIQVLIQRDGGITIEGNS